MTYRVALGAASRPTWCPATSLKPAQRDPCEVTYGFDLPLVGQTSFGLPVPAITNDALLTVEQQLPALLDRVLPTVESKLQPWIDSLVATVEYEVPTLADQIIKSQLLPEVEKQKEDMLAQADVLLQKALLGAGVITAIAIAGFWWIKRRA